jgi:hypothetical protein
MRHHSSVGTTVKEELATLKIKYAEAQEEIRKLKSKLDNLAAHCARHDDDE